MSPKSKVQSPKPKVQSPKSKGQKGTMRSRSDHASLGMCCACGGADKVRNIVMLDKKAPMPGRGWGCVVCGLPSDGAVAVLCDDCAVIGAQIVWACTGYPMKGGRVLVSSLRGTHEHDMSKHAG